MEKEAYTQKDYLSSREVPKLKDRPLAPQNLVDLSTEQREVSDFVNVVKDTFQVLDKDIPTVRLPPDEGIKNRFVEKQHTMMDKAREHSLPQEGANMFDDEPKAEQRPIHQPQPGGDIGQSHHGSLKRSVLKPQFDVRKIGRILNYEDGASL